MIAAALACRPRLLLADEPTTGLDVTFTRDILELFRAVADEQDRGVLLVSHDIAAIAEFCDRLVVLYAGSVVEDGPTGEVLARPAHPYTAALLDAVPELDGGPVVATGGSMPLLARCPRRARSRPAAPAPPTTAGERPAAHRDRRRPRSPASSRPTRRVDPPAVPRRGRRPAPSAAGPAAPILRVADLAVGYRGRLGAAGPQCCAACRSPVARGETIGVVGESGSGKTTLARVLMGLVPAVSGERRGRRHRHRRAPRRGERRRFHATAQMVFQDPVGSLNPRRTAGQAIREPLSATRLRRRRSRSVASPSSSAVSASTPRSSAAVRTSCPAARPSASRSPAPCRSTPTVVVFDEPTSALDVTVQAQILELMPSRHRAPTAARLHLP